MTRARWPWCDASRGAAAVLLPVAVALAAGIGPAGAATYLRRDVEIRIAGDAFTRVQTLEVRLDDAGDVESWSRYPIWLDDHITLKDCVAEVRDADGRTLEKISRRRHERYDSPGSGTYQSSWASLVPFPGLSQGRIVYLRVETRHEPYFPGTQVELDLSEPQDHLAVRVSGAADLRWHVSGPGEPFQVSEQDGSLQITADGVPAARTARLAPPSDSSAVLRLSWGPDRDWSDVGRWYSRLTRDVPPGSEAVRRIALQLTAGADSPRQKLAVLTAHVKRKVRYEDVEIGVGGWVPSPASQVLDRAWGDCKDKAELLRQMLAAVDIPSHLVLLRSGSDSALDRSVATPFQFNHAILAVEAAAVTPAAGDPVYGGYLLVDPTWERGGVGWLPPTDRGRVVLVAGPGGGELVEVPDDPASEAVTLAIDGEVDLLGNMTGGVEVRITGSRAVAWLDDLAVRQQGRTEEDLRSLVDSVLPGSRLTGMSWEEIAGDVPALRMSAALEHDRLVREEDGAGSLLVRGLSPLPESRLLDDRTVPVALRAGRTRTVWGLRLPEVWCPVEPRQDREENVLGRVVATAGPGPEGSGLRVIREADLDLSRIEPDAFDQLKALSLAASRADRRRVRLRCDDPAEP